MLKGTNNNTDSLYDLGKLFYKVSSLKITDTKSNKGIKTQTEQFVKLKNNIDKSILSNTAFQGGYFDEMLDNEPTADIKRLYDNYKYHVDMFMDVL